MTDDQKQITEQLLAETTAIIDIDDDDDDEFDSPFPERSNGNRAKLCKLA